MTRSALRAPEPALPPGGGGRVVLGGQGLGSVISADVVVVLAGFAS